MPQRIPPRLQRLPRTGAYYSQATRAVIDRLRTMQGGERITYAELSTIAGVNVQEARWVLESARDYLRETYGMVFDPEIGVGLICLTEAAKIGRGRKRRNFTHNYSVKTMRELQTVDTTTLTPQERHCHYAEITIAGSVGVLTYEKTARQIETTQQPPALSVDLEQYKDLFKRG